MRGNVGAVEPKFIAVDGEGLTRIDSSHDYVLLAASDGKFVENWESGISTIDCFEYLLGLKRLHPKAHFIGFSFSYDTNMMLRDLRRIQLERLHEHNRVSWIVKSRVKYVLDYVPSKWFQISKMVGEGDRWNKAGSVKVWDVFGFYQSSFLRAIEDWKVATQEQIDRISYMKLKRGEFTDSEKEQIKAYCFEECELLVKLAEQLDEALIASDLEINQYHGAGAIANVMLKKHEAKAHIVRRPQNEDLWNAILTAYFGGRVETFFAGYVNAPIYSYDVNSAYPAAIRYLPSLVGGKWRRVNAFDRSQRFALWHVKWDYAGGRPLIPFPYRRDKSIYYTLKGEGWYHAPEVCAAYDSGLRFDVIEGITFTPADNAAFPFAWVEETYRLRQALKAKGDKREKALKLGLNSLYGKFAQAVSGPGRPGQYQCYFYAGWITSYCRAEILRAASQAPDSIVNIATDGILSLAPLEVQRGTTLGTWEVKPPMDEGVMVIQPGFILSEFQELLRTRGVDKSSVSFQLFRDAWLESGITTKVKAYDTRFITLGRALSMSKGNDDLQAIWRHWQQWEIELGFFPNRKVPALTAEAYADRGLVPLYPTWPFVEFRISDPYTPRDGGAIDLEPEPVDFANAGFDRMEVVK